ncbi:hypothetical protein ACHQM5_015962 [Ranunculus cassubicifolius]
MSFDLHLKASCSSCGSTSDLYGSNCKHLTLCISCGKNMAQNHHNCSQCNTPITCLIREYNVRTTPPNAKDNIKSYFIGKFITGVPSFTQKKKKWLIKKQGVLQRDKNKNWVLEDEKGVLRYQGVLEGLQTANYYLLVMQGKEFVAVPAESWYNFSKSVEYKQLTLEEAEEKIKGRRKTADGYERWMMKMSNTGPTAFGHKKDNKDEEEEEVGRGNGKGHEKGGGGVEGKGSDRLVHNKKEEYEDEEGRRGGDYDIDDDDDDDDGPKGDDWEHDETFTDDDEANDLDDRGDLDTEVPAPPEIDQDEEDEDDEANGEETGGLSKSGKELKKLLGKTGGLNDSDDDNETGLSPTLAPKIEDAVKEEPTDNSLSKPSTTNSSKGKRKSAVVDDVKVANGTPLAKKLKTENESKPPANNGAASASTSSSIPKKTQPEPTGPVAEEEIRAFLMQNSPVRPPALVNNFKKRLQTKDDRDALGVVLQRIAMMQMGFVVLKDK